MSKCKTPEDRIHLGKAVLTDLLFTLVINTLVFIMVIPTDCLCLEAAKQQGRKRLFKYQLKNKYGKSITCTKTMHMQYDTEHIPTLLNISQIYMMFL